MTALQIVLFLAVGRPVPTIMLRRDSSFTLRKTIAQSFCLRRATIPKEWNNRLALSGKTGRGSAVGLWKLSGSGARDLFALAADGVRQSCHQLHGQGLCARRANGGPIAAAHWAFLQDELRAIHRFPVYATIENKVTAWLVTD